MDMGRSASNVKRIILEREDGTTEIITRGLIADYAECSDGETGEVGQQLGMFDVSDEEGDEE